MRLHWGSEQIISYCLAATALLSLALGSCGQSGTPDTSGNEQPARFLSLDDITDLPKGTAQGAFYEGRRYRFLSWLLTECHCPVNDFAVDACAEFDIDPGFSRVVELEQDGGHLLLVMLEGVNDRTPVATGPGTLDDDGSFVLGMLGPVFDLVTGDVVGQTFHRLDGQIHDSFMTMTATIRVQATKKGQYLDCQLLADLTYAEAP